MASKKQARGAAQRKQGRPAMTGAGSVLFSDWQRRVVLMLLISGVAFGLVGTVLAPRGATYWLAMAAVPPICAALGFVLGGGPGRSFEARLMAGDGDKAAPRPATPAALPAPVRAALQTALLPALLARLAAMAERMPPPASAAARALVEAGTTAPESAPRQALARDLPRLIAALEAGDPAALGEAGTLARHLAAPAAGQGATR